MASQSGRSGAVKIQVEALVFEAISDDELCWS